MPLLPRDEPPIRAEARVLPSRAPGLSPELLARAHGCSRPGAALRGPAGPEASRDAYPATQNSGKRQPMCGFVGIVHLEPRPVELPVLSGMARVLEHRGPDDEGSFVDGPVGFYHKRLSIIDLTSGHQPMTQRRGDGGLQWRDLQLRRVAERPDSAGARLSDDVGHRGPAADVSGARTGVRRQIEWHVRIPALRQPEAATAGGARSLRHQAALLLRRSSVPAVCLRDQGSPRSIPRSARQSTSTRFGNTSPSSSSWATGPCSKESASSCRDSIP